MKPVRQLDEEAWARVLEAVKLAEKSGDIEYRRSTCRKAWDTFRVHGFPDWWSRVQRLADDTELMERMRRSPW